MAEQHSVVRMRKRGLTNMCTREEWQGLVRNLSELGGQEEAIHILESLKHFIYPIEGLSYQVPYIDIYLYSLSNYSLRILTYY